MQQTAVQWLIDQLNVTLPKSMFGDVVMQDCFKQALEIEKQQTERDFINGYKHGLGPLNHNVIDKYYNETYNKAKQQS